LKGDWEAVGIKTLVNTVPGEQLGVMTTNATFEIRVRGGAPAGPDVLMYPTWLIGWERWARLYGNWFRMLGTDKEGTELDLDPRDRHPPREEPSVDDPHYRMWELYDQAIVETDTQRRDELALEIIKIHINEGPFYIGGIADPPAIIIASNKIHNVPSGDELPLGGYFGPWGIGMPGAITYPEQFFFDE
jgi:peptide/nickel transport system substrate-binding protein